MISRRQVMAGAALAAMAPLERGLAGALSATRMLETRLFNLSDAADPAAVAAVLARIRALAGLPGVGGVLVGRNFVPTPFPARFEWLSMVQFDETADAAWRSYERARADLELLCRNQVACDLGGAFAPGFAKAPGVGVRHTVMFDFRPDAAPADQARNVDAIRAMGQLPMVRAYHVERSALYPGDPTQMQWQVIGDFASVADYRAYAAAPVHLAIRDDFRAHTARVAFLDVQL
jgi:hypothetical protein